MINNQQQADIDKGIIKDKRGDTLDMNIQDPSLIQQGILMLPNGVQIKLNSQNKGILQAGVIKDAQGNTLMISDQIIPLMKNGVFLNPDGTVHSVNGQKPEDIEDGRIQDRVGQYIDLNMQDKDCFSKQSFAINDGEKMLVLQVKQDPEKLEAGLITAPNGEDYRVKDQIFDDITSK